MKNRIPTDDELRQQYGTHVEIRRSPPSPKEIAEKNSRLELVASAFGYQKWMWKSMGGRLLAIVIIPAALYGAFDFWGRVLTAGYEYAQPYIAMMNAAASRLSDELILFRDVSRSPDSSNESEDRPFLFLVPKAQVYEPTDTGPVHFFDGTLWRIARYEFTLPTQLTFARSVGRWHSALDAPVIYAASDVLGALEEMNLYSGRGFPRDLVLVRLLVRGTFEFAPRELLSSNDLKITQDYGNEWLAEHRSPALAVPSFIDPSRWNYLLRLDDPNLELAVVSTTGVRL